MRDGAASSINMKKLDEALLFPETLTPEERAAARQALAADAGLAEAAAQWRAVQAGVRHRLERHLPDRSLLVLYALDASGRADVLTDKERQVLDAARPALERALAAHPALADVAQCIRAEADAFEKEWEAHFAAPSQEVPLRAPDRRAVPVGRRVGMRRAWRVVAALTVVAFFTVVFLLVQRDAGLVTVETAAGETQVIELADGTTVRLLGGSTLSYPDPDEAPALARTVRLTGRAFFTVVPNPAPFTVETPTALTTVLGTRFGVAADVDVTEVVLASGSVAVAPKAAQDRLVVLEPGQMSRVAVGALASTPVAVDVAEALGWTGLFIFRATPLRVIAERLSAHYDTPVQVAPSLADEQITGEFSQDLPLEEILQTLAAGLAAEVEADPAGGFRIVVSSR